MLSTLAGLALVGGALPGVPADDTVGEVPDPAGPTSSRVVADAPRAFAAPTDDASAPPRTRAAAPLPDTAAVADGVPDAGTGSSAERHASRGDAPAAARAGVVPTRVAVPALGVDAPVTPVGLEPDGAMELPDDVSRVGWFAPGARPGASGSAVLAGHVDAASQGAGALFGLDRLEPDDLVRLVGEDGTEQAWRVVGRTSYAKDELPIEELFRGEGEPRLVLITCGGAYDPVARHYEDNVVVVAEPA
ncbi:class F sortase [Egicoccus halophilus]|uniref:Sortase family protein n=1 Tax=Egicoccus halophilus TaxID=1670830 RepID=A0A8J3ABN1_9ACTN|nr:class F sortase [Egicoccus halophilus]GGI03425.1 hypothetical protein GCM10011354_03970 [Egicoccus halophilus]